MNRFTLKCFLTIFFNLIFLKNVRASHERRLRMMIEQSAADTDNMFKHEVYYGNQNTMCTGSIISEYHVLTAAHCVVEANSSKIIGIEQNKMYIVAGLTNLNNPQERHTFRLVEKVYIPKEFTWITDNVDLWQGDIAVLKLNYKLGLDVNPKMVALNIESMDNDVYKKPSYTVTGFGATKKDLEFLPNLNKFDYVSQNLPENLRFATVNMIDCKTFYGNYLATPEEKLCGVIANDVGVKKGACNGDSGGALLDIASNTILGVLSTNSIECDDRLRPTVYTNVKSYIYFIREAMADTPNPLTTHYVSFTENPFYLNYLSSQRNLYHEITDDRQ